MPDRNLMKNESVIRESTGRNCSQLYVKRIFCDEKFLRTSGDHMISLVIRRIKDQCVGVNVVQGDAQLSSSKPSSPREDIHFDVLC